MGIAGQVGGAGGIRPGGAGGAMSPGGARSAAVRPSSAPGQVRGAVRRRAQTPLVPRCAAALPARLRTVAGGCCQSQEPVAGWAAHPSWAAAQGCTIPVSLRGVGLDRGFRRTFIHDELRDSAFVPGPGAHRSAQEFTPPPPVYALRRPRRPSSAGALREPPTPSLDALDARRLFLSQPAAHSMPKTIRTACLTSLREVSVSLLPSSFQTPGPGAYTQHADFHALGTLRGG